MIDSKRGMFDIREAVKIWNKYGMEHVPILNENYYFPKDFKEFKESADGAYNPSCTEGNIDTLREGLVYYKTTDPNFSFKNVSLKYLLKN